MTASFVQQESSRPDANHAGGQCKSGKASGYV